jgi:hypothetical protein
MGMIQVSYSTHSVVPKKKRNLKKLHTQSEAKLLISKLFIFSSMGENNFDTEYPKILNTLNQTIFQASGNIC